MKVPLFWHLKHIHVIVNRVCALNCTTKLYQTPRGSKMVYFYCKACDHDSATSVCDRCRAQLGVSQMCTRANCGRTFYSHKEFKKPICEQCRMQNCYSCGEKFTQMRAGYFMCMRCFHSKEHMKKTCSGCERPFVYKIGGKTHQVCHDCDKKGVSKPVPPLVPARDTRDTRDKRMLPVPTSGSWLRPSQDNKPDLAEILERYAGQNLRREEIYLLDYLAGFVTKVGVDVPANQKVYLRAAIGALTSVLEELERAEPIKQNPEFQATA